MKICLIFVALIALAYDELDLDTLDEQQLENLMSNETIVPETKGLILNSQGKKCVKNIITQMPCGWPEFDIPPMAPYTNELLKLQITNSVVEAFLELFHLRLDGCDEFKVVYLKISYTFTKKVKFHVIFEELKVTADLYDTDTFLNLQKLGLEISYIGQGPLEFILNDLSVEGSFHYKAPIAIGSTKISKLKVSVSLGSVTSHIGGIFGNGKANAFVNDLIATIAPAFVNEYKTDISSVIEEIFVPQINNKLKGKKIFKVFRLLCKSKHKCNPIPAPWFMENETVFESVNNTIVN